MQITVGDLRAYLESYDQDAVVKFAIESKFGISTVKDYGFISTSTEEVHGKEIIIHPHFATGPGSDNF